MQSHTWLTASSYMGKYLPISSYIRKLFLIYDFATAPTWISLYIFKIWFSFFCAHGAPNKLWRSNSIFNLWSGPFNQNHRGKFGILGKIQKRRFQNTTFIWEVTCHLRAWKVVSIIGLNWRHQWLIFCLDRGFLPSESCRRCERFHFIRLRSAVPLARFCTLKTNYFKNFIILVKGTLRPSKIF